jgi:hypothetical protein
MGHDIEVLVRFVVLFIAIAWMLAYLFGDSKPEPPPKEEPEGDGIERKILRQVVQTPSGREIVLSEVHQLSGVDDKGRLIDEQTQKFLTLNCGHACGGMQNYGGRCARCGGTFCSLPLCSWQCPKCGGRYCFDHEKTETGQCKYC